MLNILCVIAIIIEFILNGFVLCILWSWFIIPVFHLPKLFLVQAIGIGLVIDYLTKQHNFKKENEFDEIHMDENKIRSVIFSLMKPIIVLIMGWIIHIFL